MGPVVTISDVADDRLDDYRNLTDVELRRRRETAEGIFMAEGPLVIRQLLGSRFPVRSLLVTAAKLEELAPAIEAAHVDSPVFVVGVEAMQAVCGFHFHRGALAVGERLPPSVGPAIGVVAGGASLVAVLEGVNDHENVGALFRNAAAFGVDAVLLGPGCSDPLYRRSVRVSIGQVLRIPWASLSPWPKGLEDLRAAGFTLVALTPDPGARPLGELAAAGAGGGDSAGAGRARRLAVMVGSEGNGLSAEALGAADVRVRIPMAPGVDSVNVATAAAIAFHDLGQGRSAGR